MNSRLIPVGILSGILVTVAIATTLQSTVAASDNSAKILAPGNINKIPGSIDENAPKAYDNPEDIGDPNSIGDPHVRAPGLLKPGN